MPRMWKRRRKGPKVGHVSVEVYAAELERLAGLLKQVTEDYVARERARDARQRRRRAA